MQTARGSSEGVCEGKHPDGFGQLAQHVQGHFELASQSVAWHFTWVAGFFSLPFLFLLFSF
jgi:hypothetical protein